MVEHHRALVGQEWPVRSAPAAWSLRRRQYRDWLQEGPGLLLLAERSGSPDLIGYAMCRRHPSPPTWDLGTHFADVESLAVARAVRGLGVGPALLTACRVNRSRGGERGGRAAL